MSAPKQIVVIGAGVIGLQTALHFLEAGFPVTIIARYWPGDWDISYVSPRAGAHWRAQGSEPSVQKLEKETYMHWEHLLHSGEKATGLQLVPTHYYWESSKSPDTINNFFALKWKSFVSDFRVLQPSQLPEGTAHGIAYNTFAINPTQYMRYLLAKCQNLGAKTLRLELPAMADVFRVPGLKDTDAIANCTGIGAGKLAKDRTMFPVKGQTILVRGECDVNKFRKTESGWEDVVIRRPGEGTILGVSKDQGDWSENVDQDMTSMILERSKELAPELLVHGKFEIIQTQVGRRPARKGGIRIEIERFDVEGRKRFICHNYGHGGTGFQTSVGSANEAVRMLSDALGHRRIEPAESKL